MRITLSGHARQRMRERNVSREDIEAVMSSRGVAHPSAKKRTQRGRDRSGRRLEVVYTEVEKERFHIVTVKLLN